MIDNEGKIAFSHSNYINQRNKTFIYVVISYESPLSARYISSSIFKANMNLLILSPIYCSEFHLKIIGNHLDSDQQIVSNPRLLEDCCILCAVQYSAYSIMFL